MARRFDDLDHSWLAELRDDRVRLPLAGKIAGGRGDASDLAETLYHVFTAENLTALHNAAAALPGSVNGQGGLAARGVHDDAWQVFVAALTIAREKARHPLQVIFDGARSNPKSPYQVFVRGCDTPVEVVARPADGEPFRATVVPAGAGFQLPDDMVLPAGAQWPPELVLVPLQQRTPDKIEGGTPR